MTPLRDLVGAFGRIGCLSFGGPAAQIALMHREMVERRRWLSEDEYLRALSFCMLLPGPEAMQLATYCGWKLRGMAGGLIAGGLFVLPGAVVVGALAFAYDAYGDLPVARALFLGVQAAVVAIVVQAIRRLAGRALRSRAHWVLATLAFAALYLADLPFPLVVVAAAAWGALAVRPEKSRAASSPTLGARPTSPVAATLRGAVPFAVLWALGLAVAAAGPPVLLDIALFFSRLAVVTFGGAYAVLAYMAQEVVEARGWLGAAAMIDALGLAETTPGPLILVTQFVGHLAGLGEGGWGLGLAAGLMTLWVTFVPCFLWIFAGAPWLDWLTTQPRLQAALSAVTAAVVGVIANLSLWFALHVFWDEVETLPIGPLRPAWPAFGSLDPVAVALAALAGWALMRRGWPLVPVLLACALAALAIAPLRGHP